MFSNAFKSIGEPHGLVKSNMYDLIFFVGYGACRIRCNAPAEMNSCPLDFEQASLSSLHCALAGLSDHWPAGPPLDDGRAAKAISNVPVKKEGMR